MQLRPKQVECVRSVYAAAEQGYRRIGVSAATGFGKTVVMARIAHDHVAAGGTVVILVHRDELVWQTVDKLRRTNPNIPLGVVKGSKNSASAPIVVASVQTVCRPARLRHLGRRTLVICDEAHLSAAQQWMDTLNGLEAFTDGGPLVLGFSATWSRGDGKALGDIWQTMAFEYSMEDAIIDGAIVQPVGKYIHTDIKLDEVKKTAGDYSSADMGRKLSRESVRDAILDGYLTHAKDRAGVCFAPTIETAEFFREAFNEAGIPSAGLYQNTRNAPELHRKHRIGDVQVLFSCTRLSAGWDAPWVSAGIIARPTLFRGLFIQMVGRLCRLWEGAPDSPWGIKQHALVLDPVGVLFRHDLNGIVDLSQTVVPDETDQDEITQEDDPFLVVDEEEFGPGTDGGVDAVVSGYETVNLLDRGWLLTEGGIPFGYVPGPATVVRWVIGPPHNPYGTFSVAEAPIGNLEKGRWLANHIPMRQALAMLPDRREGNKSKRARQPNRNQVAFAQAVGIQPRDRNTGQLEDAVVRVLASQMLDSVTSWR